MSRRVLPDRVVLRVCERIDQSDTFGCWPWTGTITTKGYGSICWEENGRDLRVAAHRAAWMLAHGPIPDGLTIHHRCYNRRCCNPAHLQLLTHSENCADNAYARRTHCPQGHEYSPENTRLRVSAKGVWRYCRTCQRQHKARHRAKKAAGR